MRAAVLSIGDELICGRIADGNARWLTEQLARHAVTTVEVRVVGDDRDAIAGAIRELAGRSNLLLLTGGIGPTPDDLTRQALGDVLTPGQPLVTDPVGLAHLERRFAKRAGSMPASNVVQAQRPDGTRLLANPRGTALGIAGCFEECRIYVMPGPPVEMTKMFQDQVLADLDLASGTVLLAGEVHAYGLGEAAAGEQLGPLADRTRRPLVGITHGDSIVTARIVSEGDPATAEGRLAETRAAVLGAWTPYAYGVDDETLGSAVGGLLRDAGRRLATAESCTGGLLGRLIVDAAGSSDYYVGGWITYSDPLKQACLNVPAETLQAHGAVSEPVAAAMAAGALDAADADEALAITGVAGPAGGSQRKNVGTVYIGLARRGPDQVIVRRFRFPGDRSTVRDRSAKSALQMLRWALLGVGGDLSLLWETT